MDFIYFSAWTADILLYIINRPISVTEVRGGSQFLNV
jgi:hypothetical protein